LMRPTHAEGIADEKVWYETLGGISGGCDTYPTSLLFPGGLFLKVNLLEQAALQYS